MRITTLLVAAVAGALTCASAHAQTFNREHWIADFDQMKAAITEGSPNLEWQVERGLDLPAVEARTRARLAAANDDFAARFALERFLRSFGDGHMEVRWPAAAPVQSAIAPAPRSTCAELGFRAASDNGAMATRLPGFESISGPEASAAAGVAPVGGRTLGIIRISLFLPSADMCARVLAERAMPADAPCDDACAEEITRRADDLFLAEIADHIRALTARGADALLLDVAENGGGNNTSIAIARMLGGDIATPSMAVQRSPARVQDLTEDRDVLRAGLASASRAERTLLRRLISQLDAARREASQPCDLSPVWTGAPAPCSQIVRGFYAGGLLANELPTESRAKPWAPYLSATAPMAYTPGLWNGPLLVLIDGNSASSTELLAAMLQDAQRAIIVGAPSVGAGCGWNLPRQDVVLSHSGGRLSLPNCARFRANGENEIDGIIPDVLVGLRSMDTPAQRTARLSARLPAAVDAAIAQRR